MAENSAITRTIDGKAFTTGGRVFSNSRSDYRHLFGTVSAFVDGKECGNEPGELYLSCDFEEPESIELREELADRFSDLSGRTLDLCDIRLDAVVMAAEMLEPITTAATEPEVSQADPYTLSYQRENEDGISFGCLAISNDRSVLIGRMLDDAKRLGARLTDVEESPDRLYFSYEVPGRFSFIDYEMVRTPTIMVPAIQTTAMQKNVNMV